ncbi:MAG TPA: hypothetical protein VN442_24335 [Bryobacteraceae bacterium]|nr:hypothetical protein [Bryobacteraceae bacterium]
MWIRASILSVVLLAVLGSAGNGLGCYTRIGESLQAYRQSYRALDREGVRLNSLDRLIFTFVVAESRSARIEYPNKQRGRAAD